MAEELQRATGALLAVGIEPEGVRVVLLENVSGTYRLIGWVGLQADPALDLAQQVTNACQRLGARLGRPLWQPGEDGPLLHSEDEIRQPPLDHVAIGVMARPRLRVWLAGLSQGIGLTPLAQTLVSSPTRIVGHTVLNAALTSGRLTNALLQTQPEVLVLVGGYDDPTPTPQQGLLDLSRLVGQAVARLAPGQRPAIFVAGNHLVAPQAEELLRVSEGPLHLEILPNVQPSPGEVRGSALAMALQQHYWRVCQRLPGFAQINRWVTPPGQVTSLLTTFAQLTQAWCDYQGLPELHAVYCTGEWRLHIWAKLEQAGIRQCFVEPTGVPPILHDWPPVQMLIGVWPRGLANNALPLAVRWWDPSALAPIVATVGQVAPQALLHVLTEDIFTAEQPDG